MVHPQARWRLRLRPRSGLVPQVKAAVNRELNDLATSGMLTRWWPSIYEPEDTSFGGPAGTEIAHAMFCANSRHISSYLRQPPARGRPQGSVDMAVHHLAEGGGWTRSSVATCGTASPSCAPLPADTPPGSWRP
ncbi:thiopeptide-type bacteriocin biosynthesis protein [Nonomuraea angiospora]|uniref:thiopeptide-type bacteriocin biosynthesis protein n=1 Tax=Nonomuraea angiospora TaxID=46172 RepID=UPI0037A43844